MYMFIVYVCIYESMYGLCMCLSKPIRKYEYMYYGFCMYCVCMYVRVRNFYFSKCMLHYINNTTCFLPFLFRVSFTINFHGCYMLCNCLAALLDAAVYYRFSKRFVNESDKRFVVFRYECVFVYWLTLEF